MARIFVIEKQPVFRLGLVHLLRQEQGFAITGDAPSVAEALDQVKTLRPDVIVVGQSGIEAAEGLGALSETAKVIILVDIPAAGVPQDYLTASAILPRNLAARELTDAISLVNAGNVVLHSSAHNVRGRGVGRSFRSLSPRELEILGLIAHGASNKDIATECFVSETTVKAHIRKITEKMNVRNRTQAVAVALERGLLHAA